MKIVSTLTLFLILFCSNHLFAQASYSPETLEKIKQFENGIYGNVILNDAAPNTIAERMARYGVKGMSIAVIHDYKIAWAKGYGWADEAAGKQVTTETLFEPGSISKSLNAIGILKLAQDKKVDLYTDVNTYLTSWKFPYDSLSKGKKITLADILSHQAGLTVHGFPGHNINGDIPTLIQVLNGQQPAVTPAVRSEFEPGIKFQYSGGGTSISQLVLMDVTKQPYDVWMYENVLKPIGMVNSSYAQPPAKDKRALCATGYYSNGAAVTNNFHVYPEQAAAGLWMTPSDLCRYIIDMQLAYKGQPSKVLSSEMVKLHLMPYNNGPSSMGSFIEDHDGVKYFEHGAGNDGFCGDFYGSLEDGYGVVVFLNNESGQMIPDVINTIAKTYSWKNFYHEPQRRKTDAVVAVPDNILKTYEGIYLFDQTWAAIGKRDSDYYFYSNNIPAKMQFTSPGKFFNEEFPAVKEFFKDEKGRIIGYTRTVGDKEYPKAAKIISADTLKLEHDMFAEIGWFLLENKRYTEALAYFKRGVQLYPEDLNMSLNMAHAYLLHEDYKSAIAIYKAHLNDDIKPDLSWKRVLQGDFVYFKEHGFNVQAFDRVFAELKVDKPKGY